MFKCVHFICRQLILTFEAYMEYFIQMEAPIIDPTITGAHSHELDDDRTETIYLSIQKYYGKIHI